MEKTDESNRTLGKPIKSYWLERKRIREEKEREMDEQALIFLKEACEYYEENYPNSNHGISYEDKKEKLAKPSLIVKREEAIIFKRVLEY